MAVWMQIIGLRESNSLESEKKKIWEILENTDLDLKFVEKLSGRNIDTAKWVLNQSRIFEYFEFPLLDESLTIRFDHPNYISFSGSYALFAHWFDFVDEKREELTNGIRAIFAKIASAYGISELIYFSEWCFGLDNIESGEDTFEDLMKCIEGYPEHQRSELFGLESYEFYIETIAPG